MAEDSRDIPRRAVLAGMGATAAGLAGCSGGENEETERPPTETDTPYTAPGTEPQEETTQRTTETDQEPDNTTTENDETPEPEPRPDYTMQGITDEKLIHNRRGNLSKGARQAENNWNTIQEALDGEYETFTHEIEDVLAHLNKHVDSRNQTQAIAYTLTEKLDYQIAKTTSEIQDNNDNILVRGGSILGGVPEELETIYTSEGPIRFMPHADYVADGENRNPDMVLRPNETPDNNIEAVGQRAFNPEDTGTFSPLDYQGVKGWIEKWDGEQYIGTHNWKEEWPLFWRETMAQIGNAVVGKRTLKGVDDMDDGQFVDLIVTEDAHKHIATQERNGNPEYTMELSPEYHERDISNGEFLRVHEKNGELQYDITENWEPSMGWAPEPTQ